MSDDGERARETVVPVVTRIESVEVSLVGDLSLAQLAAVAARMAAWRRQGYTAVKIVLTYEKAVPQ